MGSHWATYEKDSTTMGGKYMFFHIAMENKKSGEKFTLYPDLIKNSKGQEGYSNNPDSKHYLTHDIFSYVNYANKTKEGEDTAQFRVETVKYKDTLYYSSGFMILDTVGFRLENNRVEFTEKDTAIVAKLTVVPFNSSKKLTAYPYLTFNNNSIEYVPDTVISQGLAIQFKRPTDLTHFDIGVKESSNLTPFIALKVLKFPLINFVWLGIVIMIVGFVMTVRRRMRLINN